MEVCSYTMECEQFIFDFSKKNKNKRNELYENDGIHAYFNIPKSENFNLKISYPEKNFIRDLLRIKQSLLFKFILATLLLLVLALLFTLYSLTPIRKALKLNDEFVKDILHDFNTPITSMILNIKMLEEEAEKNAFIKRISHSINTIMLLQNNLKSFLQHSPSQNVEVDLALLCKKRLKFIQSIYPKLKFTYTSYNDLKKITNEESFTRILDNLLSNAAKYNKPQGTVSLTVLNETISIKDTGKGIKNINKICDRYYKEQDRGLGLGLSIVKKLTSELDISLEIHTQKDVGTTIILNVKNLDKEGK